MNNIGIRRIIGAVFSALLMLSAYGCSRSLPNPVESKNGQSYIPIADTAFLIPEKKWLKGVARNSTDGSVCCITLHSTIPDVQPWSKERHKEMYWSAGPGKKLEISLRVDESKQVERFYLIPQSINSGAEMAEEPSEQAEQGLKKYREIWPVYDEVGRRTDEINLNMKAAYYELIEKKRMKYFIRCSEGGEGVFESCDLFFPVSNAIMATVHFPSDHLKHVVSMADKLSVKIQEFQRAGLAYRAANATNTNQR